MIGVTAYVERGRAYELLPSLLIALDEQLGAFALSKGVWRVGRLRVEFAGVIPAVIEGVDHDVEVVVVHASQQCGNLVDAVAALDA